MLVAIVRSGAFIPYERTLTAWRRQPDGTYTTQTYHGGIIRPAELPGVTVDLDALFA
ncbi:MAG: hypothetical protein KatS3mg059_0329 [Thermomicrobiales bacterium]|nr:MAG: hypothetical protein KatS3mg059_0329 [Thermomicrobiales bacterium]